MIAFSIWPINVYRYWIFYFISFIVVYFFLKYISKKDFLNNYPKLKNLLSNKLEDILIYSILWVLVWWRLWHVLIYDLSYFMENPLDIFALWKGGMSFIWWIIWVTLALLIFKKRNKISTKDILILGDLTLSIVPFGIMLWRIWNFLNQELYGIIVPNNFWGLSDRVVELFKITNIFYVYDQIDSYLRVNTNLLASFFEGFIILLITQILIRKQIRKKKVLPGQITGIFFMLYSLFRFLLEYIRQDSQFEFIWLFTKSQWFFIWLFILWFCIFYNNKFKWKK